MRLMHIYRAIKNSVLLIGVVANVFGVLMAVPVQAATLPPSEQQALIEYPNWVPCAGGSADTTSSSAPSSSLSNSVIPTGGKDVVATYFTDTSGAYTSNLVGSWSYAELGATGTQRGSENRLGGLAPHTELAITYKGKTVIAEKGDFGDGAPTASIDLDMTIYNYFGNFPGEDSVHVQLVDPSTPLGPYSGTLPSGGSSTATTASDSTGATCCPPDTSGGSNASTTPSSGTSASSSSSSGQYSALVSSGANFAGVDQGIDFTPTGSSGFKILAPGSGTITLADQTGHSFQRTSGTAEIIEKLDTAPSAPSSSQYVYFAEIIQIDPSIKVGTHVNKGDVIGTNNLSPGIETGWALNSKIGFMCPIGYPTPCGTSFDNWIKAGGGSGTASSGGTGQTQQCCGSSSSGGSVGSLSGSTPEQQIWNYFKTQGLSDVQDAAIIGNMQQESGFSPTVIESDGNSNDPNAAGSRGWGLVQWTPGGKVLGEQTTYNVSGQIYDLLTQLNIVWAEMQKSTPAGYSNFIGAFKGQTDLQSATSFFTTNFEAAGVVGPRLAFAVAALKQYGGSGGGGGGATTGGSGGSTGCSSDVGTGYQNPFRDVKGLFKRRIDQGVDYGGAGPVYAVGNAKVDLVDKFGSNSGWPGPNGQGGAWISYTLSDGALAGKIVYIAEACDPTVSAGQQVSSTTVICNMNVPDPVSSYPWIETGWASGTNTQPIAQLYGGNGAQSTTAGVSFNDFMQSLPSPPPAGILTNPPIGTALPPPFPK